MFAVIAWSGSFDHNENAYRQVLGALDERERHSRDRFAGEMNLGILVTDSIPMCGIYTLIPVGTVRTLRKRKRICRTRYSGDAFSSV